MIERTQFFDELQKLIKSSRSNYEHGRSYIGQRKIKEALDMIHDFYFRETGTGFDEVINDAG